MRVPPIALICGLALSCVASAQPDYQLHATPVAPAPGDPAIARALATIKPSQIDQTIKTLLSFGTRSTLSSVATDLPPGQGIKAAADWIAEQYDAVSRECGGCLEVKRDTSTVDPAQANSGQWARRIPRPTKITNVYAVLRGTDLAVDGKRYRGLVVVP